MHKYTLNYLIKKLVANILMLPALVKVKVIELFNSEM